MAKGIADDNTRRIAPRSNLTYVLNGKLKHLISLTAKDPQVYIYGAASLSSLSFQLSSRFLFKPLPSLAHINCERKKEMVSWVVVGPSTCVFYQKIIYIIF